MLIVLGTARSCSRKTLNPICPAGTEGFSHWISGQIIPIDNSSARADINRIHLGTADFKGKRSGALNIDGAGLRNQRIMVYLKAVAPATSVAVDFDIRHTPKTRAAYLLNVARKPEKVLYRDPQLPVKLTKIAGRGEWYHWPNRMSFQDIGDRGAIHRSPGFCKWNAGQPPDSIHGEHGLRLSG